MSDAEPLRADVRITNKRGLHARASARLVETVARFDAEITVTKDDVSVSGRSIMGLMMLGASTGTPVVISAQGPAAAEALKAVVALVEAKFGEE
jgi:phosphocarrier protein